jgi:hypothetical protein
VKSLTLKYCCSLKIVVISFLLITTTFSQSKGYYVSDTDGNDLNSGMSPSQAWQTLDKVNQTTFQPGDSILFKSGDAWVGQLMPKGSGSIGLPIVIDKYGGNLKPLIDGNGVIGKGVLYFVNQEYWEINNLEIKNDAATGADRRGINFAAYNVGLLHHIYLKNLYIHNIKGLAGQTDIEKRTGGIGIETLSDDVTPTRWDDILIEGCLIDSIDNTGLYTDNPAGRTDYPQSANWTKRKITNLRIRNNVIHHIAKNAMIIRLCEKGVVEYNVCYETALKGTGNTMYTSSCDGTVFQYNEGYFNRSPDYDGSMYDADLRSPNTVWQYSYSHDNNHGLMWFWPNAADTGIIVRYNISQNDKGNLVAFRTDFQSAYVYNNVFYIDSSLSPTIINEQSGIPHYSFKNNIIYNNSSTAKYYFHNGVRSIDYNQFYGKHPLSEPNDMHKQTTDPMFVNPGTGTLGLNTLDGYKIQSNSPCINKGINMANNGGRDFWGNQIPDPGGIIDRGAFEFNSSVGINDKYQNPKYSFSLNQNYPNPFNPDTKISFQLPNSGIVKAVVYDIIGRKVCVLTDIQKPSGLNTLIWNGRSESGEIMPSGIYICSISFAGSIKNLKMILSK